MESGAVFKMLMQPGNMFLLKLGQNYQAHVAKRRSKNMLSVIEKFMARCSLVCKYLVSMTVQLI